MQLEESVSKEIHKFSEAEKMYPYYVSSVKT